MRTLFIGGPADGEWKDRSNKVSEFFVPDKILSSTVYFESCNVYSMFLLRSRYITTDNKYSNC